MPEPRDATSMHIARAHDGDEVSRAWIVARFSPFLLMQARYRLQRVPHPLCSAEDLVDEVWLATLPRFGDLRPRGDTWKPVLMKFLGTTLLNKVNTLLMRQVREGNRRAWLSAGSGSSAGGDPLDRLPSPWTTVVSRAVRDEVGQLVRDALEELAPAEREILVLRGIEQVHNQDAARLLGLEPSAATKRYRRALAKLEGRLPRSVLDELPGA